MRVISGTARGKKLKSPEGQDVRPTLDRIKEDLFNIIGPSIRGARVLDLFAGSGALGIEALSRGADQAIFVDKSKKSLKLSKENLQNTGLIERATLMEADAERAIERLSDQGEIFDYIFIDPPYQLLIAEKILQKLVKYPIIQENGQLILETDLEEKLAEHVGDFIKIREKTYKHTKMSIFTKEQIRE